MASRTQYPTDLGERRVRVDEMLDHLAEQHGVGAGGAEWQRGEFAADRVREVGSGAGQRVLGPVDADDPVVGFGVGRARDKEWLTAETDGGKKIPMGTGRPSLTARGGKGHTLARKAKVVRTFLPEPPPPTTLLN